MPLQSPLIDKRTAADITKQVTALLKDYAPEWKEFDTTTGEPVGMSAALIGIFARFCEIIIQRLNQAPEKNFLAFLDLLGASLQPPQPARVPLTFSLTAGCTVPAVVPAGTQAAAPPAEGEKDPVIFETERELTLTPARLAAAFTREPAADTYADLSAIIDSIATTGMDVFSGSQDIEHMLYLGHSRLLGLSNITSLKLNFTVASELPQELTEKLTWELADGSEIVQPSYSYDSGTEIVEFVNPPSVPSSTVNGLENRWLRCRLANPISSTVPSITAAGLECSLQAGGGTAQNVFANLVPVDQTTMYYPFGVKPKLGDTLYLANNDAFSQAGAEITITVTLIQTITANGAVLRWEFWNGTQWKEVTVTDNTANFTNTGTIMFTLSGGAGETPQPVSVNGVEGYWIRARIISGNYGEDAKYIDGAEGYELQLSTLDPPIIDKIEIAYSVSIQSEPEKILAYNDFTFEDVPQSVSFQPFRPCQDETPTMYYGFTLPSGITSFPNRTVSLYNRLADIKYGESSPETSGNSSALKVAWEYWSGEDWSGLTVVDDTENFTRPGIVEFLPPSDFQVSSEFGREAYWIRASWKSGDYSYPPRLQRLLLNTTMAAQTVTIKNETLGSSDESGNQRFQTVRKPVLTGQHIHVRESEVPSADEQSLIMKDEGDGAISIVYDAAGRPKEIWVRWHEVPDFYGSGPRDRHYVIDHLTGEIVFGDGQSGMIPPRGAGNVRMAVYQTGGGTAGNRPAGVITQMKTTVPYVEKVINPEQASGGTDEETFDTLYERAPRSIRHRNRSITIEDYQDVAMLASPEVARALCVPLTNLSQDPMGAAITPGGVSVVIVPKTSSKKPLPSLELIDRVRDHLTEHAAATANISVVGPLYLRVDVAAEIALVSLEGSGEVEMEVREKLEKFLHPLTGGLDGKGWDFGREPYKSDLYAVIEAVPGVDHVRSLALDDSAEDTDGAIKETGRFLVYSGNHQISMVFA